MEAYRIYLRAFISARTCNEIHTEGDAATILAAVALAVHDAMQGHEPKSAVDVISAVADMCKDPTP